MSLVRSRSDSGPHLHEAVGHLLRTAPRRSLGGTVELDVHQDDTIVIDVTVFDENAAITHGTLTQIESVLKEREYAFKRIEKLEELANSLVGVEQSYAIQAGREIRVIVAPDAISEPDAALLARKIRRRIEDELQYPGTIKVTVIREKRFSETAQ